MTCYGMMTILDRNGWSRTYEIEKALVRVGCAPANDIVLPPEHGGGVLPVHLQMIYMTGSDNEDARKFQKKPAAPFLMYNLDSPERPPVMLVSAAGETRWLAGGGSASLKHGDILRLGDFSLALSIGISHYERSQDLGVKLELPGRTLRAGKCLKGRLTVSNYHPARRCQVEIELDGLPEECYQIEPAPLLPPGCEGSLLIHFVHTRTKPEPGDCKITLRVTSPRVFPCQEICLEEVLTVEPVYSYHLDIVDQSLKSKA